MPPKCALCLRESLRFGLLISLGIFSVSLVTKYWQNEQLMEQKPRNVSREFKQLRARREAKILSSAWKQSYRHLDWTAVYFNRVPKTASGTGIAMFRSLSKRNHFQHHKSLQYKDKTPRRKKQGQIVSYVSLAKRPASFDRHVFFIDFGSFGEKSPVWYSQVRDPVSRLESRFYWMRRSLHNLSPVRPENFTSDHMAWLHKDLETCIRSGDSECRFEMGQRYTKNMIIPWFCGDDPRCGDLGSTWALNQAVGRVQRFFPVVGLCEDLNSTFRVMEAALPAFFQGATEKLARHMSVIHPGKLRAARSPLSDAAKALWKANLTLEYEFYDFIKARLYRQLRELQ